jgi:hypothetical protein
VSQRVSVSENSESQFRNRGSTSDDRRQTRGMDGSGFGVREMERVLKCALRRTGTKVLIVDVDGGGRGVVSK